VSSRSSNQSWWICILCALVVGSAALGTACSGGGGGGNGGGGDGDGGVGIGADGVTVFWWKYGGLRYGWGAQALELPDGSFVAAGSRSRQPETFAPESYDAYVVRVGPKGEQRWQLDVGQAGRQDLANDLILTSDGSLLLVGETYPSAFAPDMLLARVGANGTLIWERTVGGDEWDSAQAALEIEGGFLLAGSRTFVDPGGPNTDAVLTAVDEAGNVTWEERFGGGMSDTAFALIELADGGFAFAGSRGADPGQPVSELWFVRTDELGLLRSEATFGEGCAYGIVPAPDGGFVLTGYVPDAGGSQDLVVLRLNAQGQELWRRTFGGADADIGRAIAARPTGGFLVAGVTQSFTLGAAAWQRQDVQLIALRGDGQVVWQRVKGKAPDSSELAESIHATSDGGMILSGAAGAHLLLMKADKLGKTVDLGEFDVSLDIPEVAQGEIGFGNALAIAKAAVNLLFTSRQAGPFTLEHLSAVLSGTTPQQFCALGGGYTIAPEPTQPLTGKVFDVAFQDCATSPPDEISIVGGYTLAVEAASDDILTAPFEITTTLLGIDVAVDDEVGWMSVAGDLVFERSAASPSAFADRAALVAGSTLAVTSGGLDLLADQFELHSGLTGSDHWLGPVDCRLKCAAAASWLNVEIQSASPLSGPDPLAPAEGALVVRAPDHSRLVLRALSEGKVEIALDTDGDGKTDLLLPADWDALN
jgi:hypothetical protein